MRKQIICLLLAVGMLLTAAGCGIQEPTPTEPSTVPTQATTPMQTQAPTEESTEAPTEVSTEPTEIPTEPSTHPTEAPTEPSTEPTEAPTEPSTEPTEETVDPAMLRQPVLAPPEVEEGPCNYYDDAVFIGDSVSIMLSRNAMSTGDLGQALFLVKGSFGICDAVDGYRTLEYQGVSLSIEDALAAADRSKVFIMLGMNDVGWHGVDRAIESWRILIDRIREKTPNIEIHIQSCTPVWTGGEKGDLNNETMDEYNRQLEALAAETGCFFVDVAPYMKDHTGGLATVYCSDSYVHLTYDGADTWTRVLKAYAKLQEETKE